MNSTDIRRAATALVVAIVVASATPTSQVLSRFDTCFVDKTMRVDYFHSGGMGQEIIALDRVVSDGPWPGSRTRLVDDLNLGKYLFEVIDRRTNQVIYSRGFASIYGEWETTPEAREMHRTFHESLRFPWPKDPVQVVLNARDRKTAFMSCGRRSSIPTRGSSILWTDRRWGRCGRCSSTAQLLRKWIYW